VSICKQRPMPLCAHPPRPVPVIKSKCRQSRISSSNFKSNCILDPISSMMYSAGSPLTPPSSQGYVSACCDGRSNRLAYQEIVAPPFLNIFHGQRLLKWNIAVSLDRCGRQSITRLARRLAASKSGLNANLSSLPTEPPLNAFSGSAYLGQ